MVSINLTDVLFNNGHGILHGENIVNNNFKVSVQVLFDEGELISSLLKSIDYVNIYEIVKQRMEIVNPLLETLAMNIGNDIYSKYSFVNFIRVDIQKLEPPIVGFIGSVGVSWFKNFN